MKTQSFRVKLDLKCNTGHTGTTKPERNIETRNPQPVVESLNLKPALQLSRATLSSSSVRMEHK